MIGRSCIDRDIKNGNIQNNSNATEVIYKQEMCVITKRDDDELEAYERKAL